MFNVPVYVQAALLETWKCSIMQYASIRCKTINDNQHFLELEYSCALCRFNHKRAEKHLNKQHVARLYSSGILFFFLFLDGVDVCSTSCVLALDEQQPCMIDDTLKKTKKKQERHNCPDFNPAQK